MSKRKPILFILGSTGTGKSKLALHVAQKFNGEVISADSMQVYQGLDIITNKVTQEEQAAVRHHMLSFVSPFRRFSVVDFRNKALPMIEEMSERNLLPIVVGGTYYYVESLLWQVLTSSLDKPEGPLLFDKDVCIDDSVAVKDDSTQSSSTAADDEPSFYSVYQPELAQISNDTLYKHLQAVDPKAADIVHPNSRRRVIRFLQVIEQTGRLYSDHLNDQLSQEGGNRLGGSLRFPNSCIIWLKCDQEVLDKRLDNRVNDMIKRGLIDELTSFHELYNEQNLKESKNPEYTKGIFQSIGFKEFHEYLVMDKESRSSDEGKRRFSEGLSALKMVTRRYARKQNRWIEQRFLRCAGRPVPPVYALNCTDLNAWEQEVQNKADDILKALIEQTECIHRPVVLDPKPAYERKLYTCEACERVISGEQQWNEHLNSKRHKKTVDSRRKQTLVNESEKNVSWWGQLVKWLQSLFHVS